jgi:pimeloyl-ACP methyl ester carboxylesterase
MTEPANPAPDDATGATAALAGYDYQLNVSILAVLRILFVTKSASRITLEPANADDIEVELEEDDPGHVETQAQLGVATRLIMQVTSPDALRAGDAWYQAFPQDMIDDDAYPKLTMPVLALGGPGYGWLAYVMPPKATDLKVVRIENSGHFIAEEVPDVLLGHLDQFLKP